MYSIKYRSLLWCLGALFAYLCLQALQTLSRSRAASALACGLLVAGIQEEFVADRSLELAGFTMFAQ